MEKELLKALNEFRDASAKYAKAHERWLRLLKELNEIDPDGSLGSKITEADIEEMKNIDDFPED